MEITVVIGDITTQDVDAIVNAANATLLGGGGVDGAIHRRGGPAILAECRSIRATTWPQGLPAGEAVATSGGNLPATWVIHTVGPVHDRSEDRSKTLARAHLRCLQIADEIGAKTIAFPAISTGAYGWPMDDASRIAVHAILTADTQVEAVRFVVLTEKPYSIFTRALNKAMNPSTTPNHQRPHAGRGPGTARGDTEQP